MNRENQSAPVPARDKQAEEDLWQRHGAKRGVWSKSMLIALERGIEGAGAQTDCDAGAAPKG